jgi:hypothetical protein
MKKKIKKSDELRIEKQIDSAMKLIRDMFILNNITPRIGVAAMINFSVYECFVKIKNKKKFMEYISDTWDIQEEILEKDQE